MDAGAVLELNWRGDDTVVAVIDALSLAGEIRIVLPANYNHTLFRALRPDGSSSAAERLDVSGGAEVLGSVARVDGLSALGRLVEPVREAGARVSVTTPPMLVISRASRAPA